MRRDEIVTPRDRPSPLVKRRGRPLAGYCTVKIVQRFLPLFLEYIIYRCFLRLFYQGESVFFRFLGNPSPPGFYRGRKGGSRKGRSSNGRFVMKGY